MSVPQELVGGRYRLIEVIAYGGMGVVWRGTDERLDRPVAVKQLRTRPGITDREAEIAKNRAIREAHITAQLQHPHAVPVLDAVEHEGQPCLVMPYLRSTALSAVLRKREALPLRDVVRIGAQTASALAAAHRLRIVHRDVKPGNVLITEDGTAHLSDFGISHAMGDATLTDTGFLHGTPAYLSPEVARGGSAIFASDVFSLGSMLYAALEGAPPFGSDPNPIALLHRVAAARVEPPRQAGALTPLLLQMLSEQVADRPTMDEVATSLAHLRAQPTPPEQPRRKAASPATSSAPSSSALSSWFPRTEGASTAPVAEAATSVASSPSAAESPAAGATQVDQAPPRRPVLLALVSIAALLAVVVAFATLTGPSDAPQTAGDRVALPTSSVAPSDTTAASTPAEVTTTSEVSTPTEEATSPPATSDPVAAPAPTSASEEAPDPPSEPEVGPAASPPSEQEESGSGSGSGSQDRATELVSAVTDYYALMPGNTDAAWPRMTADYQANHAGGRAAYDDFWADVDAVRVSNVEPTPPSQAQATLTYYYRDGRTRIERTAYRFIDDGEALRIAESDVLSSSGG